MTCPGQDRVGWSRHRAEFPTAQCTFVSLVENGQHTLINSLAKGSWVGEEHRGGFFEVVSHGGIACAGIGRRIGGGQSVVTLAGGFFLYCLFLVRQVGAMGWEPVLIVLKRQGTSIHPGAGVGAGYVCHCEIEKSNTRKSS